MAAERTYQNRLDTQDSRAESIKKSFEAVMRFEYGGEREQMIGAELWGAHEMDTEGLHNEAFFHTGLAGTALKTADNVRQRYPTVSYKTGSILIKDYTRLGIAYEYYPEDLEDVLANMSFITDLVGELPEVLRDAEEGEHHYVYNNGETYTGWIVTGKQSQDGCNP